MYWPRCFHSGLFARWTLIILKRSETTNFFSILTNMLLFNIYKITGRLLSDQIPIANMNYEYDNVGLWIGPTRMCPAFSQARVIRVTDASQQLTFFHYQWLADDLVHSRVTQTAMQITEITEVLWSISDITNNSIMSALNAMHLNKHYTENKYYGFRLIRRNVTIAGRVLPQRRA